MNQRATRAIIDIKKFHNNITVYRNTIGSGVQICLVVKANAYGHGLASMGQYAEHLVDSFAVATVQEGKILRKAGIQKSIFLLSPHLEEEIEDIIKFSLIPVIGHELFLESYQKLAQQNNQILPIHVKFNSGMGRIGFQPAQAIEIMKKIQQYPNIIVEGICTHFSHDSECTPEITLIQNERFQKIISRLQERDLCPNLIHASNSSAGLHLPQTGQHMIRLGIGAYGYEKHPDLHPILTLKTKIISVNTVLAGQSISYNGTWTATKETQVGVLPVGYADGYFRSFSHKNSVLIDGKPYPIIGNICMDQMMVDITGLENAFGKDVILYGDELNFTANDLMHSINGIVYELLVALSERVPREYINIQNEAPMN